MHLRANGRSNSTLNQSFEEDSNNTAPIHAQYTFDWYLPKVEDYLPPPVSSEAVLNDVRVAAEEYSV